MGESTAEGAGYGLYTAEPIKKNSFVGEYQGDLISRDEMERRNLHTKCSYIFDVNKDLCVDAKRSGNKTRYINHKDKPADGENCRVQVLLVNGEHRIKFSALRDIEPGEELFFNYGGKYGFEKKAALSKKSKEQEKGVFKGKESLAALDGLTSPQVQIDRMQTTLERRRRRSRKTAEFGDDETMADDGEQLDEDDEEYEEVREMRKRKAPKRGGQKFRY